MSDTQRLMREFSKGHLSRRDFVSRSLALGVSMGSIVAMLQACGGDAGSTSQNLTIDFMTWGGEGHYKAWSDAAAKNAPDLKDLKLKVRVGGKGDGDVANQLRLAFSSHKNIPDVVQINRTQLAEFAEGGQLTELDDALASIKSDIYPGALDIVSSQGKLYGIPYELKSKLFFYRADLFDQASIKVEDIKSVDDFIAAGQQLHGKFPKTYIINLGPQPAGYWLGELISAYPNTVIADSSGEFQITKNPVFADAFQFIKKLYDSKIALPIDDWSNDWTQSFASDAIAGSLIGNWMKFFLPGFAPQQKGKWKISLWPRFTPLSDQRYGSEAGGSLFAFPQGAQNTEAAIKLFVATYLSAQGSTNVFQSSGPTPVLNSVKGQAQEIVSRGKPADMSNKDWETAPQNFFGADYLSVEIQSYNYLKAFKFDPQAVKEFSTLNLWLQKYVTGKASLSEALSGAEGDMKTQIGNPYKQ